MFPSFYGLLGLIFITLKLLGTLDWSWWFVLAPLWVPLLLGSVLYIGAAAFLMFVRK